MAVLIIKPSNCDNWRNLSRGERSQRDFACCHKVIKSVSSQQSGEWGVCGRRSRPHTPHLPLIIEMLLKLNSSNLGMTGIIGRYPKVRRWNLAGSANVFVGNRVSEAALSLRFLDASQVAMIDECLVSLGEYGEVHLVVQKGQLRFIVTQRSQDVRKYNSVAQLVLS